MLSSGNKTTVDAKVGDNLLDVVIDNDVDIGGFGELKTFGVCIF